MAKTSNEQVATKKVKKRKMSKEEIDAGVDFILKTKELIKTLEAQMEAKKAELETQYVKLVSESEEVLGNELKVVKTARDMGKNEIDYAKTAKLLTPEQLALVEKKVIDVPKLKALIKAKNNWWKNPCYGKNYIMDVRHQFWAYRKC